MRDMINCKDCVELLLEYVDETLEAERRRKLDEHLASCPPCLHFLKSYRKCVGFAAQLQEQKVQIPVQLEARLKSFLREELQKP